MNRAHLIKYLLELRASYWFIPSLMVVAAMILSTLTVWLDASIDPSWQREIPFLFSNHPEGARSLLATVAGSMITVAGVTFSLTLLAVSHATSQFGPRLLNNFMRDRGNQITLGTFVATFIYCLLVLRTVRSADESKSGMENSVQVLDAFVPHISISVALVMALCSVAVLIYFIHHVPESIRLTHVVSNVGRQLCDSIDELFPESIAQGVPASHPEPEKPVDFDAQAVAVELEHSGYVQSIDETAVLELARKHDVVIQLKHRPGDFYCAATPLALASPGDQFPEDARQQLPALFALGDRRTLSQNTMFAVDQLVQVAQRALSPGVNDPQTAIVCLDWLNVGLVQLLHRRSSSAFRFDDDQKLRVFTSELTFHDFCERIFGQMRQYIAADRNTTLYTFHLLKRLKELSTDSDQIQELDRQGDQLLACARDAGLPEFEWDQWKPSPQHSRDD